MAAGSRLPRFSPSFTYFSNTLCVVNLRFRPQGLLHGIQALPIPSTIFVRRHGFLHKVTDTEVFSVLCLHIFYEISIWAGWSHHQWSKACSWKLNSGKKKKKPSQPPWMSWRSQVCNVQVWLSMAWLFSSYYIIVIVPESLTQTSHQPFNLVDDTNTNDRMS